MKGSEIMNPVIITASGSGGKWTPADSPYVPMTPEEIVEDAVKSFEAGATMLHLHARTEEGTPTFDPEYFKRIIEPLRERCPGVIIQMSTGFMEGKVKEKLEPLMELRPDLASFNLKGSDEETLLMAEIMDKYNVKPTVECFNDEMMQKLHDLIEKGVIKTPVFVEFVFDLEDTVQSTKEKIDKLLYLASRLPEGAVWSQTRGRKDQPVLQAVTAAIGGQVRSGLEDNLFNVNEDYVKSSHELIEEAVKISKSMGREIADTATARKMLGLA